jgi:hypothetical protein
MTPVVGSKVGEKAGHEEETNSLAKQKEKHFNTVTKSPNLQ